MLLTCKQCGRNWNSRVEKPIACPHKGCRSRIWYRQRKTTHSISEKEKQRLRSIANNRLGTYQTEEHIKKRVKHNENHPAWKGNRVTYGALHQWIRRHLPKPQFCENCKTNSPYDVANKDNKYSRDLSTWEWLCRKCHMLKDGRLAKLHKVRK